VALSCNIRHLQACLLQLGNGDMCLAQGSEYGCICDRQVALLHSMQKVTYGLRLEETSRVGFVFRLDGEIEGGIWFSLRIQVHKFLQWTCACALVHIG